MTLKDRTAVVGVGATPYYRRGESAPQTELSMACSAILGALDDAGLTVDDLDGFAIYFEALVTRHRSVPSSAFLRSASPPD